MRRQGAVSGGTQFYGVKGCGGAQLSGVVSLSPHWKGAAVPRTASPAVPDRVVTPLRGVGGRAGGDQVSQNEKLPGFGHLIGFGQPSGFG